MADKRPAKSGQIINSMNGTVLTLMERSQLTTCQVIPRVVNKFVILKNIVVLVLEHNQRVKNIVVLVLEHNQRVKTVMRLILVGKTVIVTITGHCETVRALSLVKKGGIRYN